MLVRRREIAIGSERSSVRIITVNVSLTRYWIGRPQLPLVQEQRFVFLASLDVSHIIHANGRKKWISLVGSKMKIEGRRKELFIITIYLLLSHIAWKNVGVWG